MESNHGNCGLSVCMQRYTTSRGSPETALRENVHLFFLGWVSWFDADTVGSERRFRSMVSVTIVRKSSTTMSTRSPSFLSSKPYISHLKRMKLRLLFRPTFSRRSASPSPPPLHLTPQVCSRPAPRHRPLLQSSKKTSSYRLLSSALVRCWISSCSPKVRRGRPRRRDRASPARRPAAAGYPSRRGGLLLPVAGTGRVKALPPQVPCAAASRREGLASRRRPGLPPPHLRPTAHWIWRP
jgi:hypothetical protein